VRAVFRLLAGGDPWDLTGSTVTAQARASRIAADPPALTATVTVIDATDGTVEIAWDGEEIRAALGAESTWEGVWDLQVVESGGDILTAVAGRFLAEMDVTR
jgi:hypothetical protein